MILKLLAVLTIAGMASAQQAFEVVSIKPCGQALPSDTRTGGGKTLSPGRKHVECQTVADLIQQAYVLFANGRTVNPWRHVSISGGPAWIHTDRYDIEAKAPGPQSSEMMSGPMMRSLLEDRFGLAIHLASRVVPVYALTAVKGGVKRKRFQEGSCKPIDFMNLEISTLDSLSPNVKHCVNHGDMKGSLITVDAEGVSIDEFAKIYLGRLDRPVVNKTNIAGRFNFHLEYSPDDATPGMTPFQDSPVGVSIFTALRQQLGLRLAPARGTGESLVIDRIERPNEN